MSFFTMRRFWIAVSIPVLIALLAGQSGLILASMAWFPASVLLLIWAFFTYKRVKKGEVEAERVSASSLTLPKKEITTPTFELSGQTYTFVETFSGIVSDANPINDQVWVKSDTGNETQQVAHGVPFRNLHHIRKYELHQYNKDGSYNLYKDALIVNESTGEYKVNLSARTIFIPAFLTIFFSNASMVSMYRAMPVPKFFSAIFIFLCSAALISFFTLPWEFKDGYVWDDHKYVWLTYFSTRIGSFFCIKWMKKRSEKFDNEIKKLITSMKY
ncbi:hypothetical protein [Klebsiella sp. CVUAS 11263]|uniref:hypothetical protein n=1 Tax=Klebsiella sp. CVUAS 11263 TaxID=2020689 RepID=UPI001C859911|nr:hypothetical protein [Klebsiella sp. CVUAS 11263]